MCIGEAFHDITPQKHLQEDHPSIMDVTSLRVYQCRVMAILREPEVNKSQDSTTIRSRIYQLSGKFAKSRAGRELGPNGFDR